MKKFLLFFNICFLFFISCSPSFSDSPFPAEDGARYGHFKEKKFIELTQSEFDLLAKLKKSKEKDPALIENKGAKDFRFIFLHQQPKKMKLKVLLSGDKMILVGWSHPDPDKLDEMLKNLEKRYKQDI